MRRRYYTEDETGIDFTAILDIAFVVMVLFFAATVYLVESSRETAGESGFSMAERPEVPPIHVNIDATGLLSIDGRPIERTLFEENLRNMMDRRSGAAIVIDVHPDAGREALTRVLEAARTAGAEFVDVNTGGEP